MRNRRCYRCNERWAQSGLAGMCYRCARQLREAVESMRGPRQELEPPPLVTRTVIIDGVEYLIAWAGDYEGAEARGIPLAADRGQESWTGKPAPRSRS